MVHDRKIAPRKIAPRKIAPQQIPPWFRIGVWVRVSFGGGAQSFGGQFSVYQYLFCQNMFCFELDFD